jgi:hypothetical protein
VASLDRSGWLTPSCLWLLKAPPLQCPSTIVITALSESQPDFARRRRHRISPYTLDLRHDVWPVCIFASTPTRHAPCNLHTHAPTQQLKCPTKPQDNELNVAGCTIGPVPVRRNKALKARALGSEQQLSSCGNHQRVSHAHPDDHTRYCTVAQCVLGAFDSLP